MRSLALNLHPLRLAVQNFLLEEPGLHARRIMMAILGGVFIAVLAIAFKRSAVGSFDAYGVGDWLINYAPGFIRRGLGGFVILKVAALASLRPETVAFIVKAACLGLIYLGSAWLFMRCERPRAIDFVLLLSPCTFLFPILDQSGGGRKEIALLALMTFWALRRARGQAMPGSLAVSLALLLLTLLHEGLFFFFPLVLVLLPAMHGKPAYRLAQIAGILMPSAALMAWFDLLQPKVTAQTIHVIARQISATDALRWEDGSIASMGSSVTEGFNNAMWEFARDWGWLSLLIGLAWSMALIAYALWSGPLRAVLVSNARAIVLALCCQVPLYLVTTDSGRWLYTSATLLTVFYFGIQAYGAYRPVASPMSRRALWRLVALVAALTLFAFYFRVPHCCGRGLVLH